MNKHNSRVVSVKSVSLFWKKSQRPVLLVLVFIFLLLAWTWLYKFTKVTWTFVRHLIFQS